MEDSLYGTLLDFQVERRAGSYDHTAPRCGVGGGRRLDFSGAFLPLWESNKLVPSRARLRIAFLQYLAKDGSNPHSELVRSGLAVEGDKSVFHHNARRRKL